MEKIIFPVVGEWFDLKFDHSAVDIFGLIKETGHYSEGWKYLGPGFEGQVAYSVKLVYLEGEFANFEIAERKVKIDMGCRLLEGQAVKSFFDKYPLPPTEHIGGIIFGGSSFSHFTGDAVALCLEDVGGNWRYNMLSEEAISPTWLWAVVKM